MDKEQITKWKKYISEFLEKPPNWKEKPAWDDSKYEIEEDSSIAAWRHYNIYYKVNWEDYKNYSTEIEEEDNRLMFFEHYRNFRDKNQKLPCRDQCKYDYIAFPYSNYGSWNDLYHKNSEYCRRLIAIKRKEVETEVHAFDEGLGEHTVYAPVDRIGGDCDFNFNKDKQEKFKKLIKTHELEEKLKLKLDFCSVMHHNFLNFSVMQVMGNLQGFKSKSYDENLYVHLHDRCDTLIYWLNLFYTNDTSTYNKAMNKFYGKNTSPENKKVLENYLNSFDDIYNYCNQIYFIYDDVFIDELIKNGKKPIKVAADVNRYMDLAMGFWGRKLIAFKKIDDFIEKDELDCEKEKLFKEIREMQEKHGNEIGNLIFEKW